ncbi:MAG TPA: hypothetical protein VLM40_18885, partial [Gemmata sp.]|nr:hypothetical protein [Gemmata sp.]
MCRVLAIISFMAFSSQVRADKLLLVAGGGEDQTATEPTRAKLIQPFGVDFDREGTPFLVEMVGGERVRSIAPDGRLTILAGQGGMKGNTGDGGPGLK